MVAGWDRIAISQLSPATCGSWFSAAWARFPSAQAGLIYSQVGTCSMFHVYVDQGGRPSRHAEAQCMCAVTREAMLRRVVWGGRQLVRYWAC